MASEMTLELVRGRLRNDGSLAWCTPNEWTCQQLADAIDAHLAQPAQAVDVGYTPFPPLPNGLVIHPQLGPLFDRMQMQAYALKMTDNATRAISGEKAGQVDGWPKLQADARIGATVFRNGVSTELVVGRAIREQEWKLACPACGNGTANGQPCACSFEAVTPSTAPDKEGE